MIISDTNNFAHMVAKEVDRANLDRKLEINKLSSGKKINNSRDNLGELSKLLRQMSQSKRSDRLQQSFQNAISYTQTQSGALKRVSDIYSRMYELAIMSLDPAKNRSDRGNFDREFQELREQTLEIDRNSFNGQALFRNTVYGIVDTGNLTWLASRDRAADASSKDPEYSHYMATITSLEEQQEIDRQLGNATAGQALWLGGSDANTEGEWRWVEGPEGLEEGGLGRQFWQGNGIGRDGYAVNGAFENWNDPNEPNDAGNEDALQILSTDGKWNDLKDFKVGTPTGYLQESDPLNRRIEDDSKGGYFELAKINFKRFLPSTTIDIKTISNAKDALSRVDQAIEDVIDKIAIAGSNQSRLSSELKQLQALNLETRKSISRIEDLDMARAATKLAKSELKIQSTATVFAHANELFNKRNYVKDLL